MANLSYFGALQLCAAQWRLAVLLAQASLAETRRVNKIALLTPFLSVLLQTCFLGLVYSHLLGVDLFAYLPYLAVSLALWQGFSYFVASAAQYNDVIHRHMSFGGLSPYTFHLAALIEGALLLGSKLAAALLVVVVVGRGGPGLLGLIPLLLGFAVFAGFLFFGGILAAYLLDRHRILKAMLPQLLFLAFLVTPVIWQKEQLLRAAWLADWNILHHALEIVRRPLLTGELPWSSLLIVLGFNAVLAAAGGIVHDPNRRMITFRWVA
jgi:lipopolysaccharide transport system permease protein